MEYHAFITLFVIAALVLASELSSVTADEIGGLSTQVACGLAGQWILTTEPGPISLGTGTTLCWVAQRFIHSVRGMRVSKRCPKPNPCEFPCLRTPRLRCRAAPSVSG